MPKVAAAKTAVLYLAQSGVNAVRIAICEDDLNMRARLKESIESWAGSRGISADILCYTSAEAFMMAWPEASFDLAFLDIQMKRMSGIELAEYIRKTDGNMLIVFVTSFAQYALKGYDVNALHYLIKPLSLAKLLPILDKALTIWRSRKDAFVLVSGGSGQSRVPFGSIFYISVSLHNASVHTEGRTFEMRKTMKEFVELLPDYFIRIHRSHIVNLFKVECVYKNSLILWGGTELPISQSNSKSVSDAFARLHTGR
jgi:DNA-binding LytR/AlgR family response regulator